MFKQIKKFGTDLLRGGLRAVAAKLDEVIDVVNASQQITGDGLFILVDNSQGIGQNIRLDLAQVLARVPKPYSNPTLIRIVEYATTYNSAAGYGWYFGYVQKRNSTNLTDALNLNLSSFYTDTGSLVGVFNEAESNCPLRALRADGSEYVECVPTSADISVMNVNGIPCYRFSAAIPAQVVRIDHKVGSGGVYTGPALCGPASASSSDSVTMPQGMTVGSVQCCIVNIEETGQTGWRLPVGGPNTPVYAVGTYVGMSGDSTPVPIIMIRGALGDLNSVLDLPASTYASPDTTTWDWNTNGQALTTYPIVSFGYDGTSNAVGSSGGTYPDPVTNGGSLYLWFRYRQFKTDARGVLRAVAGEPNESTPKILLQPMKVVTNVYLDGGGNLVKDTQTIYVIDFKSDAATTLIVSACSS